MDEMLIEVGRDRLQRDIDKWNSADDTLTNYKEFICRRSDKYDLQYIDLLFVSNYKGGNSIIGGTQNSVSISLEIHRNQLREFDKVFKNLSLKEAHITQVEQLIKMMLAVFDSCEREGKSCIKGFNVANCAALYHMHFPNLIPLIDRRILISKHLVNLEDKSKFLGTQVKNIASYYPNLVKQIAKDLNNSSLNFSDLRSWDKYYFTLRINKLLNESNPTTN